MGRRIPTNDINLIHHPHPFLSFTLLAAGMVAAIAIISGLCGVRHRRKSSSSLPSPSPPPPAPLSSTPKEKETSSPLPTMTKNLPPMEVLMESQNRGELPLPPAKKNLVREAYSCKDMTRLVSLSEREIAASLSMRVTRSFSMVRNRDLVKDKDKEEKGKKKKLKMEDSIWMKTIILGEKCRVPDEEEEEGNVIYEEQGRKISAYHPRTASSLSISRQCSCIDQESIPRYETGK